MISIWIWTVLVWPSLLLCLPHCYCCCFSHYTHCSLSQNPLLLQKFGLCSTDKFCSGEDKYRHFSPSASTHIKAKKEKRNSRGNKVISSSNLLSDKYAARDTLNFHYVALLSSKRHTHTRANTHILHNTACSQAYSRLMVNAWNVSVPYQTASILAVDVISLTWAVGTVFKICNENNQKKVTEQFILFFIVYQKSPCLHCAPSTLSVYGACAAENKIIFSIFSSVFRRPLNCTCLDCKACAWNGSSVGLRNSCRALQKRFTARNFLFVFNVNAHWRAVTVPTFAWLWPHMHDASGQDSPVQRGAGGNSLCVSVLSKTQIILETFLGT